VLAVIGSVIGLVAGRGAALHHCRRVRQAAAAAGGAGAASGRTDLLSLIYGLLTALAFGLWPLGRVHDVPVAALFREAVTANGIARAGATWR
jgi:putative ABC transport system permease protein